jgi:hypothetical protein
MTYIRNVSGLNLGPDTVYADWICDGVTTALQPLNIYISESKHYAIFLSLPSGLPITLSEEYYGKNSRDSGCNCNVPGEGR